METLLPEIAMSSLRPLEKAARQEEAALSTRGLRQLAAANLFVVRLVRDLWTQEQARLTEGVVGHEFLDSINAFLDCLAVAERVIERIRTVASERGEDVTDVQEVASESTLLAAQLSAELTNLKKKLAPRPLTPERIAEIERLAETTPNSDYLSHEEALARVLSGKGA